MQVRYFIPFALSESLYHKGFMCTFSVNAFMLTLFLELNDRSWWWIRTFFIDHSISMAIPSTTGAALKIQKIIYEILHELLSQSKNRILSRIKGKRIEMAR